MHSLKVNRIVRLNLDKFNENISKNNDKNIVKNNNKNKNNKDNNNKARIQLTWCNEVECLYEMREQVHGPNNAITFASPATGQVMYSWLDAHDDNQDITNNNQDITNNQDINNNKNNHNTKDRSMLLLIKRDDEELMSIASKAVKELTQDLGIRILLQPEHAAKLKHYFGVDNEFIDLFEVCII